MASNSILSYILAIIKNVPLGAKKGPKMPSNSHAAAAECAVCLSILEGKTGRRVLPCQHEFHTVCVDRWLSVPCFKNTCPVCRLLIEGDEGDSSSGSDYHKDFMRQECLTDEMVIWFSSFHVAGF
ncbi:hypothetical protein CDL12_29772 [Handroanthus impetiginosus]|uniref:RING-type E3 ubiquitin transferase n=1 Tax=Handroanthus impetiginosus TaxID=429701 RepID=A0A2G9FXH5_9LAMI|nr:hypothetical protein CDL12_29772 [Handroanthus impetiginosus]